MVERDMPLAPNAVARGRDLTVRAWTWTMTRRPSRVLAVLAIVQWLALVGLVLAIRHDGWLFYQGGDETFYYSAAWAIAHGHLPSSSIGYGWTLLLAPIALFAGASYLAALPAIVLLQVIVLLPLGLVFAYLIGERIAGRWLGYVMAVGWVAGPHLATAGFVRRYHEQWVEQFLPQPFGLTGLSDFFAMVVTMAAAWLFLRALDTRGRGDVVLAGLLAGLSIGIKPADVLFLGGPALAILVARRWRTGVEFGLAMLPALLALAVWKERGLGHLPILQGSLGIGPDVSSLASVVPTLALTLPSSVHLSWGHFGDNMAEFREFFFSMRLVEWIPFAGLVALSRVSWTKTAFVGGWLAAFLIVKGTSPRASVPDATFFRLLMPAWPAYLLCAAALPLLVPDVARSVRNGVAALPRPIPLRSRSVWASMGLMGLVPLVVLLALPTLKNRSVVAEFQNNVVVPIGGDFHLTARRTATGRVQLRWRRPSDARGTVFYRIYRSPIGGQPAVGGIVGWTNGIGCLPPTGGAAQCQVLMDSFPAVRGYSLSDAPGFGAWAYRVGMVANWLEDPTKGDVFLISRPAVVIIHST